MWARHDDAIKGKIMKRFILALVLGVFSVGANAAAVSGQGTWETTLQGRVPITPGGTDYQAYYDTVLNITWLADAHYRFTSGSTLNGQDWVNSLNSSNHLGANNWRLPQLVTEEIGCDYDYTGGRDCGQNVDTSTAEFASLYYDTLGNLAYYDTSGSAPQPGGGLTNTGPFANIQDWYTYGTPFYYSSPSHQEGWWDFHFSVGGQDWAIGHQSAWTVVDGDVAAVPEPATVWLFGLALGLLGWMRRSQKV
jgi:hypothetical protein